MSTTRIDPPDVVLALILTRLSLADFQAAAGTCKVWHTAARKQKAWPLMHGEITLNTRINAPNARPLSQTLWAACTRVRCYNDRIRCTDDTKAMLARVATELVHVRHLSLRSPAFTTHDLPPFRKLTSLQTNRPSILAWITSTNQLRQLELLDPWCWKSLEPLSLALATDTITHFSVTCSISSETQMYRKACTTIGSILMEYFRTHGALETINLPVYSNANRSLLFHMIYDPTWDPATECLLDKSVKCLLNAPPDTTTIIQVLQQLPHLKKYACRIPMFYNSVLVNEELSCLGNEGGEFRSRDCLRSLSLNSINQNQFLHLFPYLRGLVELSIYDSTYENTSLHDLLPSIPQLRLLRLPLQWRWCCVPRDVPWNLFSYLRQLSVCEDMLDEEVATSLAQLPCFQHLEMLEQRPGGYEPMEMKRVTQILTDAMASSGTWRHVTYFAPPAAIFIEQCSTLTPLLWHAWHREQKQSYRLHVHSSWWRSWIPGLVSRWFAWQPCW